ncbi:hypothetical protein Bca4012_030111 [Brassica carinata]
MSSEMVEKREDAIEASRPHSFWSPLCRDFLRWRRDGVLRFVFTGVATTTATLVITTTGHLSVVLDSSSLTLR